MNSILVINPIICFLFLLNGFKSQTVIMFIQLYHRVDYKILPTSCLEVIINVFGSESVWA